MNRQHKQLLRQYHAHLEECRYVKGSIDNLMRWARRFLEWLEQENMEPAECTYADLLSLVGYLRRETYSTIYINQGLWGVQRLYNFLIAEGKTEYNPAVNFRIRGGVTKLPRGVLSRKQIEGIYQSYEPRTIVQRRNKVLLSLICYQGLVRQELDHLEPGDIHLATGTILIRKKGRLQRRKLPLEAHQVLLFQQYLQEVRPQLLEKKGRGNDRLLVTTGSSDSVVDVACEFLKELQGKHPHLRSFQHIRNSLITQWVDQYNIRQVQYMAGHNSIITTQRYLKVNLQGLQNQLKKYHPLK